MAQLVYIGNNPLSGTDPTGYTAMSTEDRIDGFKIVSSWAAAPTSSSGTVKQSPLLQGAATAAGGSECLKTSDSGTTQPGVGTPAKNAPASTTTPSGGEQLFATIQVTAKRQGAYLTLGQEAAVKKMRYSQIQGWDHAKETRFFMNDEGHLSGKSQSGCNGTDSCKVRSDEWPSDGTVFGHTHISESGAQTGLQTPAQQADALSRDMPGPHDDRPLSLRTPLASIILTPGGEKYVIEGTSSAPEVRYLGGGNSKLGTYAVEHWQSGIDVLQMAKDYQKVNKANP